MTITTSTDGEIIAVLVSNVINQFSLESKLVGITSEVGTKLVRCKAILESIFYNTRVFDLRKTMFLMGFLDHVLDNKCEAGLMDGKYC